jgi:hypothetical protein
MYQNSLTLQAVEKSLQLRNRKTPQTRLNSLSVDRFVIQPSQLVYKDISGMHHIARDFRQIVKYMLVFYIFERHTRIRSKFSSLPSVHLVHSGVN